MLKSIIALLCVLMCFFSPYRIAGHPMPEVVGLLALALQIIVIKQLKMPYNYTLFLVYMFIVPPFAAYVSGMPGNYLSSFIPIGLIIYSLYFIFLLPNVDYKHLLKFYRLLVYISIGFFFIQELSFYTFGSRPTFYLSFFEMYYEDMTTADLSQSRALGGRSASFFLEPAHFAQYILPYFCISFCKVLKEKKVKIDFLVVSFVLLWLRSGSGYWGILVFLIYVLFGTTQVKFSTKVSILIAGLTLITAIFSLFSDNEVFMRLLERTNELSNTEQQYGPQSGFIRIWRGFLIYGALPVLNKLLGVGVGSLEYVSDNLVVFLSNRVEGTFFNGIQMLLVSGGIIGTFLFFRFLYPFFNKLSFEGKSVIIVMLGLFFIEHMWFTPKMFLYFLIAYSISKAPNISLSSKNFKSK